MIKNYIKNIRLAVFFLSFVGFHLFAQNPKASTLGPDFSKISKSSVPLESILEKLVKSTEAKPAVGVYDYFLKFELVAGFFGSQNGKARSFHNGVYNRASAGEPDFVDKGFVVQSLGKNSEIKKILFLNFGVNEYERQGVPRGAYGADVTFLLAKDGTTYVTQNYQDWSNEVPNAFLTVSNVELTETGHLVITMPQRTTTIEPKRSKKLVVTLNKTMDTAYWLEVLASDTNVSENLIMDKGYALMADFVGGSIAKFK